MTDFFRMRELIRDEERLRWSIEKQRARAEKMTISMSRSGGGGGGKTGSQVEDGAIIIAALKDEHKELTEELEAARKDLRAGIAMVGSKRLGIGKTFIRMRYLKGIKVSVIAEKLNFSDKYIHRILKRSEALINKAQRVRESQVKEDTPVE